MKKVELCKKVQLGLMVCLFLLLCNDSMGADDNISSKLLTQVQSIWGWVKTLMMLAFVVTFVVGSISVYSKVNAEEPQAFMKAAKGWLIALGFILLFFGIFSTVVGMWTSSLTVDFGSTSK